MCTTGRRGYHYASVNSTHCISRNHIWVYLGPCRNFSVYIAFSSHCLSVVSQDVHAALQNAVVGVTCCNKAAVKESTGTHTSLFSYHGGDCYSKAVLFSEFWLAASVQHNSITDTTCYIHSKVN